MVDGLVEVDGVEVVSGYCVGRAAGLEDGFKYVLLFSVLWCCVVDVGIEVWGREKGVLRGEACFFIAIRTIVIMSISMATSPTF